MCYGAEFTGRLVDLWAYHHGVRIDFSRPGKPTDNAYIETFNGSFRDECLNIHWFASLPEAKRQSRWATQRGQIKCIQSYIYPNKSVDIILHGTNRISQAAEMRCAQPFLAVPQNVSSIKRRSALTLH